MKLNLLWERLTNRTDKQPEGISCSDSLEKPMLSQTGQRDTPDLAAQAAVQTDQTQHRLSEDPHETWALLWTAEKLCVRWGLLNYLDWETPGRHPGISQAHLGGFGCICWLSEMLRLHKEERWPRCAHSLGAPIPATVWGWRWRDEQRPSHCLKNTRALVHLLGKEDVGSSHTKWRHWCWVCRSKRKSYLTRPAKSKKS